MKPVLGILLGEATGIGPELVAKLCAAKKLEEHCRPVIIGDARVLAVGKKIARVDFPVEVVGVVAEADFSGPVCMLDLKNLDPAGLTLGQIDERSGEATGDTLVTALGLTKSGAIGGFVYAPLNKAALKAGGYKFEDELRLFAHYLGWTEPCGEMNVLDSLWTSRVTSHIPLDRVGESLSIDGILTAIRLAHVTLRRAGIGAPCIAVAALNPHAGENGLCGRQEIDIIAPAIESARREGIAVMGPFPADTVFINAVRGSYDAVVTMYHDQGQIALKMLGFERGVTVAAGLPYAITTPAHGTAFDIAGRGTADPGATERAVVIAARMAANKQ